MIVRIVTFIVLLIIWRNNCQSRITCSSISAGSFSSSVSIAQCASNQLLVSCGYQIFRSNPSQPTAVYGVMSNDTHCIASATSEYRVQAYANCCDMENEINCRTLSNITVESDVPQGNSTAVCNINEEITDCSYELDPANPGDIIGAFPTFNNGAKDQCTSTNGNNGLSTPRGRCCDLRGAASLTCHSEFTGFDRAECTFNDSFIVGCSAVSNGGSSMIEQRYIAASGECTTSPGSVAIALWYGFYNANIFYPQCHDRVLSDNRNLLKFLRFMISDQK